MKESLPDSRRVTAKSILKLMPKKEHHNTTFTCQAQNTADRTYRSAKLKLEVSSKDFYRIFRKLKFSRLIQQNRIEYFEIVKKKCVAG